MVEDDDDGLFSSDDDDDDAAAAPTFPRRFEFNFACERVEKERVLPNTEAGCETSELLRGTRE